MTIHENRTWVVSLREDGFLTEEDRKNAEKNGCHAIAQKKDAKEDGYVEVETYDDTDHVRAATLNKDLVSALADWGSADKDAALRNLLEYVLLTENL